MLKNIKDLSNLIKLDNQNYVNESIVFNVLKIIKEEVGLILEEKDIKINKNILKIKSNSNKKFVIFLSLEKINRKINNLNQGFILEL